MFLVGWIGDSVYRFCILLLYRPFSTPLVVSYVMARSKYVGSHHASFASDVMCVSAEAWGNQTSTSDENTDEFCVAIQQASGGPVWLRVIPTALTTVELTASTELIKRRLIHRDGWVGFHLTTVQLTSPWLDSKVRSLLIGLNGQHHWRRQLWGTGARAPPPLWLLTMHFLLDYFGAIRSMYDSNLLYRITSGFCTIRYEMLF